MDGSGHGEPGGDDLLAGGSDGHGRFQGLATTLGERLRRWLGRHRRGMGAGLVAVLAVGGLAYGWHVTHRRTLELPSVAVTLDRSTASVAQVEAPVFDSPAVPLQLVVTARTDAPDGVRVELMDVVGPGFSTLNPPSAVVHRESTAVSVFGSVTCPDWTDGRSLTAVVRVWDGVMAEDVRVPVDAGDGVVAERVVSTACASYDLNHPVRVSSVDTTLDPVQPLVHLTWHLVNIGREDWRTDGSSGVASDTQTALPVLTVGAASVVDLPAHGSAIAGSTLTVVSCANLEALTGQGFHVTLSLESRRNRLRQVEAELRQAATDRVFAVARKACDGAPAVRDASAVVSIGGAAPTTHVAIDVGATLVADGTWTASLGTPTWWSNGTGSPGFPSATATATVHGPGPLSLRVSYPAPTCPPLQQYGPLSTMPLLLSAGARTYPVDVPFDLEASFGPGSSCVTRGG